MSKDTAAEFIVKRIRQQRERIVESMTRGMNFEPNYHRAVGQVEGLDYAIALINDTAKRVAEDKELTDDE
jgi:hypothetical protein